MGPFELMDLTGLDVTAAVTDSYLAGLPALRPAAPLLPRSQTG